ncbi:MAG: molybdopterin-guanine dinucleotide biosynthesis protein [Clostridiales bacterium]|nr:molybdopterin-guanine dinucleotide biosynthesis protein [Clostridiales bacterium]
MHDDSHDIQEMRDDLNMIHTVGILCGGNSRRMGENKAMLLLKGRSFLQCLLEEFGHFDEIMLAGGQKEADYGYGIRSLPDENKGIGPIEGIRQVLKNASSEYVFICGVDMPLLKHQFAFYLEQFICSDYDCYVIKEGGRRHPLCGIYKKSMLPLIETSIASGEYRLNQLLDNTRLKEVSLRYSSLSAGYLKNINTREDYRHLIQILQKESQGREYEGLHRL